MTQQSKPVTPAEELRAAATKLREMAKATVGGIWTTEYLDNHECWWVNHRTEEYDSVTCGTVADLESVGMEGNAAWIALMGPDKAEPLAAWLDSIAKAVEALTTTLKRDQRELADPDALAFARAVLGEKALKPTKPCGGP